MPALYNEKFGLCDDPFRLGPDPSFLFLTEQHRDALSGLTLGILQRRGLVVLIGEPGAGKTTLLTRILQFLPASRLQFSNIVNPTLTASELLELALFNFGLTEVPSGKSQRLLKLLSLITEGQQSGKVSVLIIDEAHKLSPEALEEIRLLGNLEDPGDQFLQILLVGQTELDATLDREELRPLKNRIGVRLSLGPLAPAEVGEYMRHRWLRAGGKELPFTPPAIEAIVSFSQRIPRIINVLCDNALLLTLSDGSASVTDQHVREAAANLALGEGVETRATVQPGISPPAGLLDTRPSRWNRLAEKLGLAAREEST